MTRQILVFEEGTCIRTTLMSVHLFALQSLPGFTDNSLQMGTVTLLTSLQKGSKYPVGVPFLVPCAGLSSRKLTVCGCR